MPDQVPFSDLLAAYHTIFDWIVNHGVPDSERVNDGLCVTNGRWRAHAVMESPAGRFGYIQGPNFMCYYRPDAPDGYHYGQKLDLRAKTTPERLLGLARDLSQFPKPDVAEPPLPPLQPPRPQPVDPARLWALADRASRLEPGVATPIVLGVIDKDCRDLDRDITAALAGVPITIPVSIATLYALTCDPPEAPPYTTSLDAARSLVPPMHDWVVGDVNGHVGGTPYAQVGPYTRYGATPILSFVAAALTAMAEMLRETSPKSKGKQAE